MPTLQAFCSTAESRLSALTDAQTEMNERLGATARHFGENPNTINSHELFSTFDAFLQARFLLCLFAENSNVLNEQLITSQWYFLSPNEPARERGTLIMELEH